MNDLNLKKIALNTSEACEYLSINRNLLDSFRNKGLIKAIKTGRFYIYPIAELNKFINQNLGNEISKEGVIYERY